MCEVLKLNLGTRATCAEEGTSLVTWISVHEMHLF